MVPRHGRMPDHVEIARSHQSRFDVLAADYLASVRAFEERVQQLGAAVQAHQARDFRWNQRRLAMLAAGRPCYGTHRQPVGH